MSTSLSGSPGPAVVAALLAVLPLSSEAAELQVAADPDGARILTADIDRFWQAYDAGRSSGDLEGALQEIYQAQGSAGLADFFELRIESVDALARTIDAMPGYFESMRESTLRVPEMIPSIRAAFYALKYLYPDALFPDVTFVIGRLSSGGTTSENGLLIGTEMYGLTEDTPVEELDQWLQTVLRPIEAVPHIVAHELVHFQQADLPPEKQTLLAACFREGSADFVAELISGRHINEHVHAWALPREAEIWREFQEDMGAHDTRGWLYGRQPEGWPADVGYFVGYRIAHAYYERAGDRRAALAEILRCEDVERLLDASGYDPSADR